MAAAAARPLAALGLVIGLAAVILQFVLTIPARMETGRGLLDALVFFFTYFTILTNIMLVLIYLSELMTWRWLGWWRSPVTRGMMVGAITLVSVFYHLLLAGLWSPEGWFKIADVTLHYVTPIYFVGWWLVFQPKGSLRFADIGWMLLPVALWLVWAMGRGAVIGEYPYPILEANTLGYLQVAINCLVVLAALIGLYAAVIAIDRWRGRKPVATQ